MEIKIALLCTIGGGLLAYLTFNRNRDKDVKYEAAKTAVMEAKLDNINQGVDSIRFDIKEASNTINDLKEQVVRVDESTKQAHKRIDTLEKESDKNG